MCLLTMEDITEIVFLKKLIPICSICKRIRNDSEYWETIEKYLNRNFGAELSHGICPECAKKYYPDMNLYGD